MDQFYIDCASSIVFIIIFLMFALIIYLLHTAYRIYKTKKVSDSLGYVSKIHYRMFFKFWAISILFFVCCIIIKSILE